MNENIVLLPCPFCGSANVKTGSAVTEDGIENYVMCYCGAKLQLSIAYTKEDVMNKWNKRAIKV